MVVLIVDSSEIIAERLVILVNENIEAKLCTIHKIRSYQQGIEILRNVKPDIVLLDTSLPGNKSVDLFNAVKKVNKEASFIILFNYENTVAEEQYNWLGTDFIFDKYHEFEKIPGAIDKLTAKKRQSQ